MNLHSLMEENIDRGDIDEVIGVETANIDEVIGVE